MKAIPMEHELRFVPDLLHLPFDFRTFPYSEIIQGYLNDEKRTRIRRETEGVRNMYTRTVKTGEGISRTEEEVEITEKTFDLLWKESASWLTKKRYRVSFEGIECELNIFGGDLEGYAQIEVEFNSHEEARSFAPPWWLGPEVTHDKRHTNGWLAEHGIPKPLFVSA